MSVSCKTLYQIELLVLKGLCKYKRRRLFKLIDGITDELLARAWALPVAKMHHFNLNLTEVLHKSTQCQKHSQAKAS